MSLISVCKQVIAQNNKSNWINPKPSIRVSNTRCGKVTHRSRHIGIVDENSNIVAEVISTTDGKPVISCGAKVAITTKYTVIDLDS